MCVCEAADAQEIKRFVAIEIILGSSDVDGSFQLLLAVIVVVHQFTVPQHKPAHFPVSEAEGNNFKEAQEDTVINVYSLPFIIIYCRTTKSYMHKNRRII